MTSRSEWRQGNWNAFVVFECTIAESRKRCRQVPEPFKDEAISHAATYWKIQGHQPRRRQPKISGWPRLEVTAADLKWGKKQLAKVKASGKTAPDQNFGELSIGYTGERVVDRWLTKEGIPHTWNNDPDDPRPDFEFGSVKADLKTHTTKGAPRPKYQANVTDDQSIRSGGNQDWYLFAKVDQNTYTDLWVLGFLTPADLTANGKFYRKGDLTDTGMLAKCDCWCIAYEELIKPFDWLGEYK